MADRLQADRPEPRLSRPGGDGAGRAPAMFALSGRTTLVTGASGGVGPHFTGVLPRQGARVALVARRLEALNARSELVAAGG